jgi:hypothetical protein
MRIQNNRVARNIYSKRQGSGKYVRKDMHGNDWVAGDKETNRRVRDKDTKWPEARIPNDRVARDTA